MAPEAESRPAPVGFARAVELFLEDMRGLGRLTTDRSVAEYRRTVRTHSEDAQGADPHETSRQHVKATLRRWGHPNAQRRKRATESASRRFRSQWWAG